MAGWGRHSCQACWLELALGIHVKGENGHAACPLSATADKWYVIKKCEYAVPSLWWIGLRAMCTLGELSISFISCPLCCLCQIGHHYIVRLPLNSHCSPSRPDLDSAPASLVAGTVGLRCLAWILWYLFVFLEMRFHWHKCVHVARISWLGRRFLRDIKNYACKHSIFKNVM